MVRPRPPMSAATFAPTGNSPPGQDFTNPTHSMPITFAASAHSPRRMCISAWLMPNALISMTTCPALGSGSGMSLYTRLSSPPNFSKTMARIAVLPVLDANSGCEEVADRPGDLHGMCFQRKMARVEEVDDGARNVAPERLRARRQEERVVLAPHREQGRPVRTEVLVELRVQRNIAGVVEEQIELDLVVAGPSEQRRVERIALGRDQRRVLDAVHVLPPGRLWREEVAERGAVVWRRFLPVALDRVPAPAQPHLVGVAVLGDDRRDPLRVAHRETESHRRAVVEDVDGKADEPDHRREPVDDVGEVIEGVRELRPVGRP